ncbi:hybrid sensor histidine kinase/response regulator [Synoicihabitans lomoniglobus]|uniref:histidine kinase n=1 Tax=Synoicihabitans lomoniglobus TaxID=2909285 RepID=A0AAF0I485_9BACT|nr:hybrid sensor histidine kinase/response regulator [Opitutaceae bacterium LMO-M01]WED66703.1 hybrid sensor histidine kinase/response regulator [Opitutaceae bacterium LMO-M01]
MSDDLSDFSLFDLFRLEAENQTQVMTEGLLALERDSTAQAELEACMRAAHSLKGAARIVGLDGGVSVAHVMEDCFVAAQQGGIKLDHARIDVLLQGVDLLTQIAQTSEADVAQWEGDRRAEIDAFLTRLSHADETQSEAAVPARETATEIPAEVTTESEASNKSPPPVSAQTSPPPLATGPKETGERVLRVTADNLDRMLALASESLVESRWLKPFGESLRKLRHLHQDLAHTLDAMRETEGTDDGGQTVAALHDSARELVAQCQQFVSARFDELEEFDHRSSRLSHRLYDVALAARMRPFADGVHGFPRLVRDVSRELGKQVRLELVGEGTTVDRNILEKLEAPLGHLLRNAIDHGVEAPEVRSTVGKPAEATIRLEARHNAGTLQVIVADDGRGIDIAGLRDKIVRRGLTNEETAQKMSETELWEFLFLPGFTMKDNVTKISGRGVGLDVVQSMVKQVRGTVRVTSQPGIGTRFLLQLPLTLSVVRALLVEIGGEVYAFPLANLAHTMKISRGSIAELEGRAHFDLAGQRVGLVSGHQVLGGKESTTSDETLSVVVVGETGNHYGIVVDRFREERELVVQPLDARLGKIQDIAAAAVMTDGSPVLIIDVEDMVRSVEKLVSSGQLSGMRETAVGTEATRAAPRILVVDDSLTVRELERKVLVGHGYQVEVAVDGMDGWNAVRSGRFDLVVTDVDMPRMDGIELVSLIKQDPHLSNVPVMIISYKDREEDRRRGLDAGADYYLTKGSFHDDTLVETVVDLIGEPNA